MQAPRLHKTAVPFTALALADSRGLGNLLAHIGRFQQKFPGGYFRTNWFRQQLGQMLAEWTQFSQDGSEFITAHSYARLNDQDRISHFSGFWKM